MEQINTIELGRRIDYLQYSLLKIEKHMLTEQSERVDIKSKIAHLHTLQNQPRNSNLDLFIN